MICQTAFPPQDKTVDLKPKEKISISVTPKGKHERLKGDCETDSGGFTTNELEEEEASEKERNFTPKISQRLELNPLEQAVLRAKPLAKEPDKAKTNLGEVG
jgi:hypothetical protein